jgi:hypothetical protein
MNTAFKCITSTNHSKRPIPRDLEIKLQLLTFTVLFFHRYKHSAWSKSATELDRWRNQNVQRARNWLKAGLDGPKIEHNSYGALQTSLDGNYHKMLFGLKIPVPGRILDRKLLMPLLDILPDFMALCAAAEHILPVEKSMELAAQFMLQASLEQYFVFGRASSDIIDEAFAWGPSDASNTSPGINGANVAYIWQEKRSKYIHRLRPTPGESLDTHFQKVSRESTVWEFEGMIMDFLFDLLTELQIPALLQLEMGGLTELGRIN